VIRAIDRFYAKHPRIALGVAILIAAVCLYAAQQIDNANATELRQQWLATNSRSAT
jgi:predicted RND superfamily exporter protein